MKVRAVIFEDDDHVRAMLERALARRRYEVLSYPTPRNFCASGAGVCMCGPNEACADIVISDVMMPLETGIEFMQRQRTKGCHVGHVALLSGFWTTAAIDTAHRLGCEVFEKPFGIDTLTAWLDRCETEFAPLQPLRTLRDHFCRPPAKRAAAGVLPRTGHAQREASQQPALCGA